MSNSVNLFEIIGELHVVYFITTASAKGVQISAGRLNVVGKL